MTKLAFVDVETTGTESHIHEVWEIGLVLDVDGRVHNEWEFHLEPDLTRAASTAMRMNGFYDRAPGFQVTGSPPPRWDEPEGTAQHLARTMRGAIPANCNVHFDLSFLTPFLLKHGMAPTWHYSPIDVKSMAYVAMGETVQPDGSLAHAFGASTNRILEFFKIKSDGPDRHTALGDAKLARRLFYAVLGKEVGDA